MLKYRLLMIALFCFTLGLCRSVRAQSFYGPDGLLVHPTAFTQKPGLLGLYASYLVQYRDVPPTSGQNGRLSHDNYFPLSMTYGLSDKAEVAAITTYEQHQFGSNGYYLGAFAKYQLMPDTPSRPAFALVGTYSGNDVLQATAAGVFSHNFVRGGRRLLTGHLGLKWAEKPAGSNSFAPYVGLELPLNRQFELVAETSTKFYFERAAASAVGVIWNGPRNLSIRTGFVNGVTSNRFGFFFGVGFPLGGGRR